MVNSTIDSRTKRLQLFQQVAEIAVKEVFSFIKKPKIKLLNYSENATFLVENLNNNQKYILRVARPGYHSREEIESEIFWQRSVAYHTDVEVSLPIPGADGNYVQPIKLVGDTDEYHTILFNFLDGEEPDVDDEEKLINIFEKIGEITAHFHNHIINNWEKFKDIKRHKWDLETIFGENPTWGKWEDGRGVTEERKQLFKQVENIIISRLTKFGKSKDRFGLIHSDLRHANLLVNHEKGIVQVIDFDDSGFSWYLYDLAASLTFIEHYPYVPKLIEAWKKGYKGIRQLSPEEEAEIPTFIMMRRLQILAWIGSRDNETADEMGEEYTVQTVKLAEEYINNFKDYV